MTFSDDDGQIWQSQTSPPRDLTPFVSQSGWNWVGSGPPGGIQLTSGRLLIPAYHGPFHGDDGTVTSGYVYYSDDHGTTWKKGGEIGKYRNPTEWANEAQAVDLGNNTVLVHSRGVLTERLITVSTDGGVTFGNVQYAKGLSQPLDGCEGSTVRHPKSGFLYYSGMTPDSFTYKRYNMTFHVSQDQGSTWSYVKPIYQGAAAYSSLVILPDFSIGLLYEWAKELDPIFTPDVITYTVIMSAEEEVKLSTKIKI